MPEETSEMFRRGPAWGQRAHLLLVHFDGALDAGGAGRLSVGQMLRTLPNQRVATFDSDQLVDYRSHRPILTVIDWVHDELVVPEIALDLLHDDNGTPFLLLHGPEPDARWESFARTVADIAEGAGVELCLGLHGVPWAVPHTRPTFVHAHATDASLLPGQVAMQGFMQFPASAQAFLQNRLSDAGIEGVTFLASVPYYVSDQPHHAAASALLGRLAEFAHLSLPVGDLEVGAAEDAARMREIMESNREIARTVESLEAHVDALQGAMSADGEDGEEDPRTREMRQEGVAIGMGPMTMGGFDPATGKSSTGEDLTAAIESYLRTVSSLDSTSEEPSAEGEAVVDDEPESLEDVLRRVELRRLGKVSGSPARPRHRAPAPGEGSGGRGTDAPQSMDEGGAGAS